MFQSGRCKNVSPVIVLEVVDTLPFDGLLQDLGPAAAELLPHLHQPGTPVDNVMCGDGDNRTGNRRRC